MRTKKVMKFLHLFLLRDVCELVQEALKIIEVLRTQEVEEVEQFFQIVLQGSPCQKKFVVNFVSVEHFEEPGLIVLEPVSFIDHQDLPLDGGEGGRVDA